MDQMEHNVKIKDYKRPERVRPFLHYEKTLCTQTYPSYLEQSKMFDRFKEVHWKPDQVIEVSQDLNLRTLKQSEEMCWENQHNQERSDVALHRLNHLQGIKDNIQESRDRFFRRTQLERPGAIEKQLGDEPLYKIVNDAKHVRY